MAVSTKLAHSLETALGGPQGREAVAVMEASIGSASDNIVVKLGTDGDQALVNRASSLSANTALTDVLIGTPAVAAIPANSLVVGNVTADGDQVFATVPAGGTNSIEWMRNDASAGLTVFNEAAGDIDFRVEGDTNANMHVIDAGTDSQAFGSAVVAGAGLSISNLTGRATVTSVGVQLHSPAGTFNDTAGAATIAIMADHYVGIRTHTATNARTYSDCATVYIAGAPVASTNVTQTRSYAMLVDAGIVRIDEALELGLAGSVAGVLKLSGATSGTITMNTAAAAGTWTFTLPADDGDAGEQLQTNGSGVSTWEAAGSFRAVKNILEVLDDKASEALDRILTHSVYAFQYKPDARKIAGLPALSDTQTVFHGILADDYKEVMMWDGKIFNPISAFGESALAIKALFDLIAKLEARLAT